MHTVASLVSDLRSLSLPTGGIWIVHSGYRAIGPVEGGPAAVVAALVEACGGTVMVPTFTQQLTDPYTWPVPPPEAMRQRILTEMKDFDPATTPPTKMGAVSDALWRTPGAVRSRHPVTSWAAIGPRAGELLADPPLDDPEGPDGPIGRAWKADAVILLVGVGHDADTSVHLAESLLDLPHLRALPDRYPARDAHGNRIWCEVGKTTKCSDAFGKLDPDAAPFEHHGRLGDADARWIRSRDLVRAAVGCLLRDPTALLCDDPECVHCPTSRRLLQGWRPGPLPTLPP